MNKNKWGYKKGSPYANQPYIDIQGNDITMVGVPHNVLALPDNDKPIIMKPGKNYKFPNSKTVREIPIKQHGGNFGLAGENTMPMSPFISLKPFINKYKLKHGGVIDYMSTLPEEQQYLFAEEFDGFDEDTQNEISDYLNGGYYQMGGNVPVQASVNQGNAELEGGETLIDSSQKLKQVKGKKHSEGGEDMLLEGGTRIYSEHLKAPQEVVKQVLGKESKKKYSYADLSKRFPTQPSISILSDPKSDDYEKTTASLTLANNLGKLDTIFFAQEKEKQGKEGNNFQDGGWVTPRRLRPNSPTPEVPQASEPIDWSFLTNYGAGLPSTPYTRTPTTSTFVAPTPLTFFAPVVELEEEYVPTVPTDLQLVMPQRNVQDNIPVVKDNRRKTLPNRVSKPSASRTNFAVPKVSEQPESDLWQVPLPLEQISQRTPTIARQNIVPSVEQVAETIVSEDDQNYVPTKKKWDWSKFGISPELAGTVADIGLALSDQLRVSEPTFYDRTKTPLFTRFVDFDDKEVQRMFDKNIQQIQQSNIPEQVKQAQISELTSKYQDYQAKVDYGNLQRYEGKRERDTDKLQRYLDTNIDQRVADIESYRMKKARVDELRNAFKAQRKSRVVNSLKAYAEYADQISKANEFTSNYRINPVTGRIDYRPQQQSQLRDNILQQYQKKNQSRIDLGSGATAQIMGNVLIITDKDGKVTTQKLDTQE